MSPSQNRLPGKRVSAGLLQHGKWVRERHNNVHKCRNPIVREEDAQELERIRAHVLQMLPMCL